MTKRYTDETEDNEAQGEEDLDKQWESQNDSPIAGKISGSMEELRECKVRK